MNVRAYEYLHLTSVILFTLKSRFTGIFMVNSDVILECLGYIVFLLRANQSPTNYGNFHVQFILQLSK